jgi:hypothetical protein
MANKALNKTPKFDVAKPPVRKPGQAGFIEWCNMVVGVSFDAYEKIEKEKIKNIKNIKKDSMTERQAREKLQQWIDDVLARRLRGAEGGQ